MEGGPPAADDARDVALDAQTKTPTRSPRFPSSKRFPRSGEPGRDVRVLGVALEEIPPDEQTAARFATIYHALGRRFDLVGNVQPTVPVVRDYVNTLAHFYPTRDGWRARAGFNRWRFRKRTESIERQLGSWNGRYDVILQLQTLFAPGTHHGTRPYTVFTDNTYSLTKRNFPAWAPLPKRQSRQWADLEAMTCRDARYVFVPSNLVRDAMVSDYGCDPERVIRVGFGTSIYEAELPPRSWDTQAALFVGIQFARKGGPTLLRAWEMVARELPGAELWVVGPKSGPGVELPPGVRWLGYMSGREALADLYHRASAFVLPSVFDPYPNVLREAMGYGLPCVGTDSGGIPEIIVHGETGSVVPPGEPEPLARALIDLLSRPAEAERMGRAGHAAVVGSHTWDRVAERIAPYLERAAAGD
jgi:glycosyltransferase involved in cell wall biosynthesis